jgi:murein DD-endopeptidase MepM/ murein hydrolase activator NlpD
VDIFVPYGAPLYAVADATVQRVGTNPLGGLTVHLRDDAGDVYYYAHLSGTAVATGERVRAGQVVGTNGDSGNARGTPPHLHWEYRPLGGPPVNPYPLAAVLCRPG